MYKSLTSFFLACGLSILAVAAQAETRLMMAEEPGCVWCARWNAEIGAIYEKTGEGAAAPLLRVDLTQPFPADITLLRTVNFTPTFILLQNNAEVARLEGYPGEDFFWALLGQMLNDHAVDFVVKTRAEDDKS